MAGTSGGWYSDRSDPSRQRYWNGRNWSASLPEREAAHRSRAMRQQAMFVVLIMAIIAACWLLYDKPWQVHRAHAPTHHSSVNVRR